MGEHPDCRDRDTCYPVTLRLEEIFNKNNEMERVREIADRIKGGIEKINPFIQRVTQVVCPECKDVCCISKHGYYNFEDLVYIHALGLKPAQHESGRDDSEPCQFLSEKGCTMDRTVRPSGCNWYFCNSLLDHMEKMSGYQEFDDDLRHVAELWMEMTDEFAKLTPKEVS